MTMREMLHTRDIPRLEWPDFCQQFSEECQGQAVTIEVASPDHPVRELIRDLPFQGMTADLDKNGTDSVSVIVGELPDSDLTHTVTQVMKVRLHQPSHEASRAIEVQSNGGAKTWVHFRNSNG